MTLIHPRNWIGYQPLTITYIAAAIEFRIRIQYLVISAITGYANAIIVSWYRREVQYHDQELVLRFALIADNGLRSVVTVNPFKAFGFKVVGIKLFMVTVEFVQVTKQFHHTLM